MSINHTASQVAEWLMHCPVCQGTKLWQTGCVGHPRGRGNGRNPSIFCSTCGQNYVFWLDSQGYVSNEWTPNDGLGPPERRLCSVSSSSTLKEGENQAQSNDTPEKGRNT